MKTPNFFPNSIKYVPTEESHRFFCALAYVQFALEHIPNAEDSFTRLIQLLNTRGMKKLLAKIEKEGPKFARSFGKYMSLYILQNKKLAKYIMWPRLFLIMPSFFINQDFRKFTKVVRQFILEVFNNNPKKPRTIGSPLLYSAIGTMARFSHAEIDPYEYDKKHRPLSAEMARVRPTTVEGRKTKVKYDSFMKRFIKITDKKYRAGARRWISARVIYSSVAEAERELHLRQGSLNQYFNKEPWDDVMGYQKR